MYQKDNGNREIRPKRVSATTIHQHSSQNIMPEVGSDYSKPEGIKDIPTFLVIFSGGEKREKDYFSLIEKRREIFSRIKIKFLERSEVHIENEDSKLTIKANESGFSPDKLWLFAEYWIKERYTQESEGESINPIDDIYLISDVDHFITELLNIKPKCHAANIKLIMSNSCFEKWLYYGYYPQKPVENPKVCFNCPEEKIKISSAFKTYTNRVVKGGFKTKQEIFRLETAISNARTNYKEDEHGIPELYSTNFFILGEQLLSLIKPEMDRLKEELENKASLFRR